MRSDQDRKSIRERFMQVESANVADVLDEMGVPNQGIDSRIQGITGQMIAGWSYTIAGQMIPYEGTGDPKKMEACNGIGPDEVSVWSGQGSGICYFGELIALGMAERGSVGSLVDGGIRDCRALTGHNFPVFGRYRTSVQSIGRWRVTNYQEPVYLPGATSSWVKVRPGDFVIGDDDGCVVIPDEYVDDVLETVETMTATEAQIRKALQDGMTLSEALEKFQHV